MITSKLTSKAQTTIPQAVRNALGVKPGDAIAYAIEGAHVVLTKAAPAKPPAWRVVRGSVRRLLRIGRAR